MCLTVCLLFLVSTFATGYSDNEENIIGESLDIFANYGDLSQMIQMISGDFDEESSELFTEKTLKIFENVTYHVNRVGHVDTAITFLFCDTFDELMDNYYSYFAIQGADKPWKSFMGDWLKDEILQSLGVTYDPIIDADYCCFVLTRLSKIHTTVTLDGADTNFSATEQIKAAVDRMNADEETDIRRFTRSYGTHYIDSYATGNSVYQVFVYSRHAYRLLKLQMRHRRSAQLNTDDLRFYTSSFFLRQIGQVMVASGNKTVENWCEKNLRDSQYLYSRPTLLKLYNNSTLLHKLNGILDNGAMLQMKLKIISPVFKDEHKKDKFLELVDNDLKLWEVTV